ncbi:beta-glucosidase family protein [Nesterenkonia populi]
MWRTSAVKRLGVPSIVMSDGPNGLRFSPGQADEAKAGADFGDFISMVNERRSKASAVRVTEPATCFPTASSVGATWDPDAADAAGEAMGRESRLFGVSVLLGPGMNLRRTPLAGRSSEYYSEDPLLTAHLAAAVVRGLQGQGVGACIKHYAANNSEIERTSMDSVIEARALHDSYLRAFELVIEEAAPWVVMSSYNRFDGVNVAQNRRLLTEILRDLWGYDGVVVSDWHGITDRPASLRAGNDLDMPQSRNRVVALERALAEGEVSRDDLDVAVRRVLRLLERVEEGKAAAPLLGKAEAVFSSSHAVAERVAVQGTVLLHNDGVLPLSAVDGPNLLVLGQGAEEPVIQGFGSARMTPVHLDIPLAKLREQVGPQRVRFLPGIEREGGRSAVAAEQIRQAAAEADAAVVFAHTPQSAGGENADRKDLALDEGYDELIEQAAATGLPTIVVLTVPDAVSMPWLDRVSAVLAPFYAGQGMGGAVAKLLFGEVSPSGKLPTTFPRQAEDIPGYLTYPGEAGAHFYAEGPYPGYRAYHVRKQKPLFPFGFGLSYTTFAFSDLRVLTPMVSAGGALSCEVTVENTGPRDGSEVVQLYFTLPWANRPQAPQLAGFQKVHLAAGERRRVVLEAPASCLSLWDERRQRRALPPGPAELFVGNSSENLPLSATVDVQPTVPAWRPLRRDTEPAFVLENPLAREAVGSFAAERLGIDAGEADAVLQECARSFVNVFDTLANRFDLVLDERDVQEVVEAVEAREREQYPNVKP